MDSVDRPDLIIIEVDMPETGAIDMVSNLHRSPATRNIPVIVISDFPDLEFELLHVFDFICKPLDLRRLAEDLRIIAEGRKKRAPEPIGHLTAEEHMMFHDFLIEHSGLHFERRNIKLLERGLEKRMRALRIESYRAYFAFLEKNMERRQELDKLLPFLTVGETFFFRYNAHFEALSKTVLPAIARQTGKKSLRIWSAGCSTGEEPYSLAITVMEAFPDWKNRDIRIHATDINNRSLRSAKEGVYGAWKMRVTPQQYMDRYFRRIGESYVVRNEVKSLVQFSYCNLQAPDPMNNECFDIIFCRNVMIYFAAATTKKLVEGFAERLNPGGYLFLGHSETLAHISTRFERHIQENGFYYTKKPAAATAVKTAEPSARPLPPVPTAKPAEVPPAAPPVTDRTADPGSADRLFNDGLRQLFQENLGEAAGTFRKLLAIDPRHVGAILAMGQISLASGNIETALTLFDQALGIDDLLPQGYFLRGFAHEIAGRPDEAVDEYRKAVLLKPDFVMPHYQLGKLYHRSGDEKASAREFRNSIRLLEKSGKEKVIPFSSGMSREVFLEQVRKESAMAGMNIS